MEKFVARGRAVPLVAEDADRPVRHAAFAFVIENLQGQLRVLPPMPERADDWRSEYELD